jgi:hypothetical protein
LTSSKLASKFVGSSSLKSVRRFEAGEDEEIGEDWEDGEAEPVGS